MPIETVDSIKRRMIRNASKIWGYHDVQDINSFDPVLGLMMGALAEELHAVSREINISDARVIDTLLEVLFSQNLFSHFPAHGVVLAHPTQPRVPVSENVQFYLTREVPGTGGNGEQSLKKNIYFTPIADSILIDGEVRYLMAGSYVYEVEGRLKEIIGEAPKNVPASNTRLLFGIHINSLVELLDGLSLFFSFKNIQPDDRFYHSLHSARWKINGQEVVFRNGLEKESTGFDSSLTALIKKDEDISYRAACFIHDFHRKKFMTLEPGNYQRSSLSVNAFQPPALQAIFQDQNHEIFDKDILWVEADLSHPVSFDAINDLVISINSFPVMNRELVENTHSIVKGMNVIPLTTDDLFFDVRRVTDSKGDIYSPRVSAGSGPEESNTYYLRQGGVARFDSRDARETIRHLTGLVRDEAAAFSVKGADLISHELKQLDQILTRLEHRIDASGNPHGQNAYLILESGTEYEKVQVQFWSIAGELANNIRPGSKLSVYRGVDLDEERIALLTPTAGGRQKLSKEDKLNKLRRSLLSRGRIVTKEDVKALCYELFGDQLKKVEVKKGVSLDYSPGRGMTRTLDILLYLNAKEEIPSEDIWHKTESLKIKLKEESVNLIPYRVFVK